MQPVPPDAPPVESAPAEVVPEAPASADERLHLARERARHGDWAGTRIMLEPLHAEASPAGFTARYLWALSLEFEGSLDEALAAYDVLLTEDPTDDVRFRRAETLGKLGRYDEARRALRELPAGAGDDAADAVKLDVLEGVWASRAGKSRGARQLRAIVDAPASMEPTFYLAEARLTLLERATTTANALGFDVSERRMAKNLEQRAALVLEAEHELADLIRLDETGAALRGFVAVAGTYLDLGDDLRAGPVPPKLTDAQASIYRDELGQRVAQVWAKSSLYADKGLEYAARQDWIGEPVATLAAVRAEATSRVDGGAP